MTSKRLPPLERSTQLLDIAVDLAAKHGLANVTRDQVAKAASIAPGTVSNRMGTMTEMRRSVMRHAVAKENLAVIAQGLATKDRFALKAPEALRLRALEFISGVKAA